MKQDIRLWFAAVCPRRSRKSKMSIAKHKIARINSPYVTSKGSRVMTNEREMLSDIWRFTKHDVKYSPYCNTAATVWRNAKFDKATIWRYNDGSLKVDLPNTIFAYGWPSLWMRFTHKCNQDVLQHQQTNGKQGFRYHEIITFAWGKNNVWANLHDKICHIRLFAWLCYVVSRYRSCLQLAR